MHGGRGLGSVPAYAVVAAAAVGGVALRLPFLGAAPYTDEGGLLVVAREWHTGGPYLYGDLFLDRPPLLLLYFRAAAALGGVVPVRVLGLGLVAVAVVAAAWAGSILAGRRGAVVAAVVLAALLADPVLGAREVNAETVALPFTTSAVACVLEAMRHAGRRRWLLVAGGAFAVGALLVKQNLADALVFALVCVAGSALAAGDRRRLVADLGRLALGVAVPLAATLVWAVAATPGLDALGYSLYGFRIVGGRALLAVHTDSQGARLRDLVRASLLSGMVPVLLVSGWLLRRRLLREPVAAAPLAMLAVGLVGVAGGGYYWTHYLISLAPVTAFLAALASRTSPRPGLLGLTVALTVTTALLATTDAARHRTPTEQTWVGGTAAWVRATREPGDHAVVLYGEAALYESAGLRPVYPYLWTLPMRVLDPHLTALRELLAGHRAPTFVIVDSPLDAWGIDPQGRVPQAIERHYRRVAVVCGSPVYLRRGVDRPVAPPPAGCG